MNCIQISNKLQLIEFMKLEGKILRLKLMQNQMMVASILEASNPFSLQIILCSDLKLNPEIQSAFLATRLRGDGGASPVVAFDPGHTALSSSFL